MTERNDGGPVSPSDPLVILAGIEEFGLASDGSDLRDLRAAIEALHWKPRFDAMEPEQEELAVKFSMEIAGPKGQRPRALDPVGLLEMAEALYQAEYHAVLAERERADQ